MECDKCGKCVEDWNNAVLFCGFYMKEPETADYDGDLRPCSRFPRHLFPVWEEGEMVCEGSPSRAQYLPGATRDMRPGTGIFSPEYLPGFIRAFKKFQEQYPAPD